MKPTNLRDSLPEIFAARARSGAAVSALCAAVAGLLALRVWWELSSPVQPRPIFIRYVWDLAMLAPAGALAIAAARVWPVSQARALGLRVERVGDRSAERFWPSLWLVALLAALATGGIRALSLRCIPQIVDEAAYLFQAATYAGGSLSRPALGDATGAFLSSMTVEHGGRIFGVFFPLWSLLLAPFASLGVPGLLPILVGAALVVLTGLLGATVAGARTGLLAALLLATSPFFLMQTPTLFGHGVCALLITAALLATLEARGSRAGVFVGAAAGALLLARPLTGALLELWFAVVCAVPSLRGPGLRSPTSALAASLPGVAAGALLLVGYDRSLTGGFLTTPHDLAFPHMFGLGPHVASNTATNLVGLAVDAGLMPFAGLALALIGAISRPQRSSTALALLVLLNVALYGLYRYHGFSFGPRFYYESFPAFAVLAARGLGELVPLDAERRRLVSGRLLIAAVAGALVVSPVALWSRLACFRGRAELLLGAATVEDRVERPAMVFLVLGEGGIGPERTEPFVGGLARNDVALRAPVIYGNERVELAPAVQRAFPERWIYALNLQTRALTLLLPPAAAGVTTTPTGR